jgi:hypothetical protein
MTVQRTWPLLPRVNDCQINCEEHVRNGPSSAAESDTAGTLSKTQFVRWVGL